LVTPVKIVLPAINFILSPEKTILPLSLILSVIVDRRLTDDLDFFEEFWKS